MALTPNRLVDSRGPKPLGLPGYLTARVPAEFFVTGRSSDVTLNVPADAVGVTGNLTAVGETSSGYFALTPDDPDGRPRRRRSTSPRANASEWGHGSAGARRRLWVTFVGAPRTRADAVFDVSGYFTMD